MPFVSEKQRRLCWLKYNQDLNEGKSPKWDCKKWEKETKKLCNYKCKDGHKCNRIKTNKKYCWQHNK